MTINYIKHRQKQILLAEIEKFENDYQERCQRFLSRVPKNLTETAKDYLNWLWWGEYEPRDRMLQLALIQFEKYERL